MLAHHRVVVLGGGTAGITVAARLRRAGHTDIALVDPARDHYYQPLWTLVGGGRAGFAATVRPQARLIPRGVRHLADAAVGVDPDRRRVSLASGASLGYDALVVCPGLQLDWHGVPGLVDALSDPEAGVTSNYAPDLVQRTWPLLRSLRSGTAVFTLPPGPVKCPGAAQKIAYLAADWYAEQGVLDDVRIVLVLPGASIFGVPEFARVLERVVERYGIEVRYRSEVVAVDPAERTVAVANHADGTQERLRYDVLHAVPPQSAPDWVKAGPLAGADPKGWVEVDRHTLEHQRFPNVFSLGDVSSAPTAKTGAAIRKQAPVVVRNLSDRLAGRAPTAGYDGYAACPLTTARNRMLLAEFDYDGRPAPSLPVDAQRERYDMWLLKRHGLPFYYWNVMLRGLG